MMVIFIFAGREISGWFISDSEVILQASALLVVGGLFQFFDGAQVIGVGGLRGLHETRFPAFYSFVFYWLVALPLAWVFGFGFGFGPVGIWVGLALGLGLASLVFGLHLWKLAAPATGAAAHHEEG
jgi:MATE family multidrug resistance protein